MGNKSDTKAGDNAVPLPLIGKREGENEDEQQVSAKKHKRDEVSEEQRNKDEIVSDSSFSDSEPDKNPEAKKESLSKEEKKGKPASANCSISLESLADGSLEDEGNMDIDKGDNSEESDEETQKKMEVLSKMRATPNEQNYASNTIITRNLSFSVERADLETLFKECGEIVDIRLHTDFEGRFLGFGHVEFATAEAAQQALQLNNTELLKCRIKIGIARQKYKPTPNRSFHANFSNSSNTFQKGERSLPMKGSEISGDCKETEPKMLTTCKEQSATSKTIYAGNLSYSMKQADMEFFFKECGEIVDIRLHTSRGYGHVEFATTEAAQKALDLNNTLYLGRRIGVFIAQKKGEYISNRSNWSKSFYESEKTQPIRSTESSENCKQEIEGKTSKSPWESSKRLATLERQNAPSKIISVRNLSYSVLQTDVEDFFKECGEILDIRLHRDQSGRLNGIGQVEFATEEAAKKALDLNNTELLRRTIKVNLVQEKGEYTYSRSWSNSFQKCERNQSPLTIFVSGFDRSLPAAKIKASLEEHFGSCGDIIRISIPKCDSDAVKGFAHLEFDDVVSMKKALLLDQIELGGYPLRVEKAKPRHDNQGVGNDRGGGHHFGGRNGTGYSSRVGWGKSGGAGWHSLHYSDEGAEEEPLLRMATEAADVRNFGP